MSDVSDVANGLAYTIAGLIYPNGMTPPTGSVTGRQTIVRRGWLMPSDAQGPCSIRKGIDYVTVRTLGTSTQETPADLGAPWRTWSITEPTVSLAVNGNTATVSIAADATPSGVVGLKIHADESGAIPDNSSATYVVQSSDTPATIAAALAGQFPDALSNGATLTISGATSIDAVSGGYGLGVRVLSRQVQNFVVSVWSSSWAARDALGKTIVGGLMSGIWFAAADGWPVSVVKAPGSIEMDALQMQGLFRRDIQVAVRFDTIETQTAPQMLFAAGMVHNQTSRGVVLQPFGAVLPATGAISDGNGTFYLDAAGNLVFGVQQPYSGFAMDANGNVLQDSAGNLAGIPS